MELVFEAGLIAAGMMMLSLVFLEVGRRLGAAQLAKDPDKGLRGTGTVEGVVFGLLGLLLAFTFSGAAARFDARRHLVVEEANAIGTAYLRVDMLAEDAQPRVRELFRRYLDSRIDSYKNSRDRESFKVALDETAVIQAELWSVAGEAVRSPGALAQSSMLLLPALNQMFDIATTRYAAMFIHAPAIVFVMLALLVLGGALLAGFGMADSRRRSWLHMAAFAVIVPAAVFVIIDFEFPRLGTITVEHMDQLLAELRQTMR